MKTREELVKAVEDAVARRAYEANSAGCSVWDAWIEDMPDIDDALIAAWSALEVYDKENT